MTSASAHAHHAPPAPAPRLRHRKNIELMRADQLAALRQAHTRVMQISDTAVIDNRGYQYFAGLLYLFELALRDQVANASLAWWDWTSRHMGFNAFD